MKVPVIELFEYNFVMSLLEFFQNNFQDKMVNNKPIDVVPSFFDRNLSYISPSITIEVMYRKNRKLAFGDLLGEVEEDNEIIEIEGTLLEYRIQLNVYSNTGGENLKLSSLLDEVLKIGDEGIPLNTYNDNGTIKQSNVGIITYDYSSDVKYNLMAPNIKTYDFHNIYEIKMEAIQTYKIIYDYMEIANIIGQMKN